MGDVEIRCLGFAALSDECADVVPGTNGRRIGPEVMEVLRRYRHPGIGLGTEAGGILLGRYIVDTQAVIADEATEPAPADERLPFNFHRLDEAHAQRVMDRWRESDGRVHYLGEWHTHAEPWPRPSPLDLDAWRGTVEDVARQHRDDGSCPLLFVIAGQAGIGVWEGRLAALDREPAPEPAGEG